MSIEKHFKGNVGMYLVASKLSQMNLIALTTSRNTKGYDIVVLNPNTNRGKGIQVKCSDFPKGEKFPVMSSFLRDYLEKIEEKIVCDFVFVDISNPDQPRFFVVPMEELRGTMKKHIENYEKKQEEKTHKKPNNKEKKPKLWVLKLEEIEKFENNWGAIIENL